MTPAFRCGHVALIGRSNAGKSTLLNRLVGRKVAIVSPVPQTTRTLVVGVRNRPDAQVVFVDTPGVHLPQHALNRRMLEETRGALQGVDAAVVLIDVSDKMGKGDSYVLDMVRATGIPHVVGLNKVDVVGRKSRLLPLIAELAREGQPDAPLAVVPLSGLEGTNVEELLDELVKVLPESPAIYPRDITTDQSERFLLAELIREKVLHATREEVPHATTVLVDAVEDKPRESGRDVLVVHATLAVEKEGQKGILIGRGGEMLKRIGSEARKDIEERLDVSCHLALHVKVIPRWRDDRRVLAEMFEGTRDVVSLAAAEDEE